MKQSYKLLANYLSILHPFKHKQSDNCCLLNGYYNFNYNENVHEQIYEEFLPYGSKHFSGKNHILKD